MPSSHDEGRGAAFAVHWLIEILNGRKEVEVPWSRQSNSSRKEVDKVKRCNRARVASLEILRWALSSARLPAPGRSAAGHVMVPAAKREMDLAPITNEGGAGVAGVIKGILILESGIIPPNVNFERVNPKIPMKKWNLQFPLKSVPWPTQGVRRISINSFGVGGTNAHVILDDAYSFLNSRGIDGLHQANMTVPTHDEIDLLVQRLDDTTAEAASVSNSISTARNETRVHRVQTNGAHTNGNRSDSINERRGASVPRLTALTSFDEAGVQRLARMQAEYLKSNDRLRGSDESAFLDDFAYTISGRSPFPWRSHVLASNVTELIDSLMAVPKPLRARNVPRIGFVFTGQAYLDSIGAPWSLMYELLREKPDTKVNEPSLAHPACTALQVALVDLFNSWEIRPTRVVGHSSGEIAAAYCAGKLTREAAWKVAYFRGFVSSRQLSARGSMMAVALSQADLQPYLERFNKSNLGELIVACYNSPKNVTVSGDEHKIDALKNLLDGEQVFARKLQVKNGYHSSHMREVADEYFRLLGSLSRPDTAPSTPVHMFSTVTGQKIDNDYLQAEYWVENLVSPVRFADALTKMCSSRAEEGQASIQLNATTGGIFTDVVIELGPHAALQSAVKEILTASSFASAIASFAVLNRSDPGLSTILNTIGELYSRGSPIDITKINQSSKPTNVKVSAQAGPRLLVNLPGYAFNHSEKLIYESRLTKNYRLRKQPRHDLFGAPVTDWNSETPRWRNIWRIAEQPWIRDHIITNQIVLPGVAYLTAAMEAFRQIADPERKLIAFRLRDVFLKRAMIIPDDKDGIETVLSLDRMDESALQASNLWRKFTMSSYNPLGEDWIEHCTGYIAVDYETASNPIDDGLEAREESVDWGRMLRDAGDRCVVPIDINDVYDNLVTTGLEFGPLFKNLSEVKGTDSQSGEVLDMVTVPDVAAAMPKGYMHDHLIHPCTMDGFLHFFLASVMDVSGKKTLDRPMVPTFIKDVWVSAELRSERNHQFCGYGKSTLLAYDKYESNIRVWDADTKVGRVSIQGIRATPLEASEGVSRSVRKLNHELNWTPYLDLLEISALPDMRLTSPEEDEDYKCWINKFQIATLLLLTDALKELGDQPPEGLDGHLLRYFEWMNHAARCLKEDKVSGMRLADFETYANNPELKKALFQKVAEHNADGALALRMGRNIVKVLRKEEDSLHLMFGMDDLLNDVYAQVAHLGDLPALQAELLKIVASNSTNLRVLEIGAGTGGSTSGMLVGLTNLSVDGSLSSSISTYTFTDISLAFFEKAKEKFRDYRDFMEYKVLDIEREPDKQAFELGSYDIVVAQNVVHATTDLKKTFGHIRSLLKPSGKIFLQEGVRQDLYWSTIAFGQLPG